MTNPRATDLPGASSRRLAVAAGIAAAGGLGLGWWKFIYSDTADTAETAETATASGTAPGIAPGIAPGSAPSNASSTGGEIDPVQQFWLTSFDTPAGSRLPLASFRGKPLLVNFWATWCPPCVEELPLIDAFYRQNKANGWQVVGIAADQLTAINTFLSKMPLSFPVALAGMAGVELSKSLGNLSGGLPFTVILGSDGTVRHRKIGRVSAEDLTVWSKFK